MPESTLLVETKEENLKNKIQKNITRTSISSVQKQINKLNTKLPDNDTLLDEIEKKNEEFSKQGSSSWPVIVQNQDGEDK